MTDHKFKHRLLKNVDQSGLWGLEKYFRDRFLTLEPKFRAEYEKHTGKVLTTALSGRITSDLRKAMESTEQAIQVDLWCAKNVSKVAWGRYLTHLRVKKTEQTNPAAYSNNIVKVNLHTKLLLKNVVKEHPELADLTQIQLLDVVTSVFKGVMDAKEDEGSTGERIKSILKHSINGAKGNYS